MIHYRAEDRARVLAALYNASQPRGMSFWHYTPGEMTLGEAEEILRKTSYFDYLQGRVMKVHIDGGSLDPRLYDRDNGEGAALEALEKAGIEVEVV